MMVQITEEDLKKLKNQNLNYRQVIRTLNKKRKQYKPRQHLTTLKD